MKPEVATKEGQFFNYGKPPAHLERSKMILLTHGKTAIFGRWANCEGVIGWYPLPDRDKEEEQRRNL